MIRRILCRQCGASTQEPITFCAGPYLGYTKWLAYYVLALRKEMSITAVADLTGLHWDSVKNIEKTYLSKKYQKVSLGEVQYMGIDEVYLGIKLMNERMDGLRRSTMNKLADEQKKELKGKRFLLLRNQESLSAEAAQELKKLRFEFEELGTASMMKEYLRNIYKMADCCQTARTAFTLWCEKAEVSGIHCLKQMAKTIRKRIEGLLAFWKHKGLTNASQEGFNNKIGWLTR